MKLKRRKILLLLIIAILSALNLNAQRQNDTWVFGNSKWDFDPNQTNGFIRSQISNFSIKYGTSSISHNVSGNLLFYSDGISVLDKNGNLMQNGGKLFGEATPESDLGKFYTTAGLCGGNRTPQPVLILPKPNSPNLYYVISTVFTTFQNYCTDGIPNNFYNFGVRFAIIDMTNPLGNVISKNNVIQTVGSPTLTTTLSSDGNSYWLVTTNGGSFNSYKIDLNGISNLPITSTFSQPVYGSTKISPNGQLLFNNTINDNNGKNNYSLYNFNASNGQITNRLAILPTDSSIDEYVDSSRGPSNFAFSEDSNIIYFTSVKSCLCTDFPYETGRLSMYNINLGVLAGGSSPAFELDFTTANLQLSENGKIYLINNNQSYYSSASSQRNVEFGTFQNGNTISYPWGVINNPNAWSPNIYSINDIIPPLNVKNGYAFPQLVPELSQCTAELTIVTNVLNGESDIQSAGFTLTATNTINVNALAEYDAGITVFLKPGFHAKSGSDFRGYILGCLPEDKPKNANDYITVNENQSKQQRVNTVLVFPNPSSGKISVESNFQIKKWELLNQFGPLNSSFTALNEKIEIDLQKFPNGFYFLKITFDDDEVVFKTVIKE